MLMTQSALDNSKKTSWGLSWIIAGLLLLTGCGGGEETASPLPPPPPAPPKPAAVAIPEPANDAPAKAAAAKKKVAAKAEPAAPADPDAYLAFAEQGNYNILDALESQEYLNQQRESVLPPAAGITSSHFAILETPQVQAGTPAQQKRLPPRFVPLREYGYDATGWPKRIRCEVDQSEMAFVPAGVFLQGKNGAGEAVGPEISMYLSPYYIDIHEVTVENFMKYRDAMLANGENAPQPPTNLGGDPKEPACGILYRYATAYLEAVGKELPTEAEWEKAARGASGFDHPWGYGRPAWRVARQPGSITPVMTFPTDRSYYGVFDMAGNVPEWCADWYAADTHEQATLEAGQVPRNWKGPRKAEPQFHRVIKGASPDWSLWQRTSASMSEVFPNVGFRGVLRIPEE